MSRLVQALASRGGGLGRQGREPGARVVTPYLLVGAAALYLLVFTAVPLLRGLWFSFTDSKLLNPARGRWVGLDNYARALRDDQFWASLGTTIVYTASTVLGTLILGTIAAVAINEAFRGRGIVRSILVVPWAVPSIAVVLVFIWMFNVDSGVLNRGVQVLGLGQQNWLQDPSLGLFSVTLVTVWKIFPFVMLVVLAALQGVPAELKEAGRVDGADRLSIFRSIVMPHLMPTFGVVALLMSIWSIRRFEIIYLLTGGGPVDSTNTLVINVYREAFQGGNLGRSAALAMLGLMVSLVVTVTYLLVEARAARANAR